MAGQAVDGFGGDFAGFLVDSLALDGEGLANGGKFQIAIERGSGPNGARFEPPVHQGDGLTEVCWPAVVFEVGADVVEQSGLIVFGGEQVMGVVYIDQMAREFALGQQGIGGDGFGGDVQALEEGDEHTDFIGLFERIGAGYGQRADFFWV